MTTNTTPDLPYGLLDQETGNFVGFFQTEAAALAVVADSIDRYGKEGVDALALARFIGGDVESVAEGEELAERAIEVRRTNGTNGRNGAAATPATVHNVPRQQSTK